MADWAGCLVVTVTVKPVSSCSCALCTSEAGASEGGAIHI